MQQLFEFTVHGLLLGAVYGLIALPFSVVWATTGTLDAALGGYAVVAGLTAASVGFPAGIVVAMLIGTAFGAVMGLVFLGLQARGLEDPITVVLASLGFLFAVDSFVLWRFGVDPVYVETFDYTWTFLGVRIPPEGLLTLAVGLTILVILVAILRYTPLGRSMRACAIDAGAARLVGIPVRAIQFGSFALGGLLAGTAGVLTVGTSGLSFEQSVPLTLGAFGALIIFGMRGPGTAFLGGLVLGTIEAISAGYISGGLASLVPLAFILIVLGSGRLDFAQQVRP